MSTDYHKRIWVWRVNVLGVQMGEKYRLDDGELSLFVCLEVASAYEDSIENTGTISSYGQTWKWEYQ